MFRSLWLHGSRLAKTWHPDCWIGAITSQSVNPSMKIRLFTLLSLLAATTPGHATSIDLTTGLSYHQNFDSLANTGTNVAWVNGSTLDGWSLFTAAGTPITTYNANDGSSNTGSFYSYGDPTTDRALGGLGSGAAYFGSPASGATAGYIAVSFTNFSAVAWDSFTTSWNGEEWRNGGNTSAQTMVFQYGVGSTFSSVASWITPGGSFNWTSPVTGATAAPVDGNVAGLVTGVGGTVTGLTLNPGDTLWLRSVETNDVGNDHGLAIDNFSFSDSDSAPTPEGGSTFVMLGLSLCGLVTMGRKASRRNAVI